MLGMLLGLFRSPKILGGIFIISLLSGGLIWYQHNKAYQSSLLVIIQNAKQANTLLRRDITDANKINSDNQIVIKKLEQDQIDRTEVINKYEIRLHKTQQDIDTLQGVISASGKKDDGLIAPVLLNTLSVIQKIEMDKRSHK